MAVLKLGDYIQRSISIFLFGTTIFASYFTFQTIRHRLKAKKLKDTEETNKEVQHVLYKSTDNCVQLQLLYYRAI